MPVLKNIGTLVSGTISGKQGDLSMIPRAALAWQGETFVWAGAERELPEKFGGEVAHDARNAVVIPGLIDCHTHLAFGGWRSEEFVQRCMGKSYSDIAKAGGGIVSTVKQTRACTQLELEERCLGFLRKLASYGVTTIEAKSGYGLDVANELKILQVYAALKKRSAVEIVPTLLAAHAVPPEFKANRRAYVDLILNEIIPQTAAQGLARFCDVFVDATAFTNDEAREILSAAARAGMRPKLHVDQLSDAGGGELAAELNAVSADHLEYVSDAGISALARKKVVAVVLPLATLFTRQTPVDARRLIDGGVEVAVSTDFNPGSAPSFHLPLAMMLGCTLNKLSPAEVLNGATIIAAKAIGMEREIGSIEAGKFADFALLDVPSIEQWMYHFTSNVCVATVKRGVCIAGAL